MLLPCYRCRCLEVIAIHMRWPMCITLFLQCLLQACTAKMNLSEEVDLEDYVGRPDKISNAEISAICQEAGMHAVRKNRSVYFVMPAPA